MNSDEIYEIKKTWLIPMESPTDSGAAILLKFFDRYPSNLDKFASFKDLSLEELADNARFRAHATRIIKVFDESVNSLGEDSCGPKLEEMWSKIAVSHFNRQIDKQSFNELKEVILEVLGAACSLNEDQSAAWEKLVDSVYEIIFRHMDELSNAAQ